MTAIPKLVEKLGAVSDALNTFVLEREDETRGILLSVLSGTNTLFLGDVGTAKSHMLTTASKMLGLTFFDILMSETTKPDQLFGPVDIPALAEGRQQYKWQDYAPGCNVLFFDEIFKANATTLNPLLWLMNEHRFRDGDNGIVECPTYTVFAASNEVPTDPVLKAVFDRLLMRFNVKYLKSTKSMHKLVGLLTKSEKPTQLLTKEDVDALRAHVKTVDIPKEVVDLAIKVRHQIEQTLNYKMSDRRFLASFRVMQASAVLRGDSAVSPIDVEVFAYIGWNDVSQQKRVENVVYASTSADVVEVSTYLERVEELKVNIARLKKLTDVNKELRRLYDEIRTFRSQYARRAAMEVRELGHRVSALIASRRVIEGIVVTDTDGTKIFKMHSHFNKLWTVAELRTLGLRHKRKADYWYTKNLGKSRRAAESMKVKIEISNKPKDNAQ